MTRNASLSSKKGEAIGRDDGYVSHQEDARLGSQILAGLCLDYFCRIANKAGVSLDDVLTIYANLRPTPKPGTERIYRGQAAERLAA